MQFTQLPPEIIDKILIEAVLVRGAQRASRLRYVCRTWATSVMHAIFASGILDRERLLQSTTQSWYRSQYLAYEVLGTRRTRGLQIIRRVAERIVLLRSRKNEIDDVDFELVRECVQKICEMPEAATNMACSREPLDWLSGESADSIDDDMQFKQALLTAAAWVDEGSLVEELLPSFRDHLYLISWDGWGGSYRFELIFGTPIAMAAMQGNLDILKFLIQALAQSDRSHYYARETLMFGARANQLSMVDFALTLENNTTISAVTEALERTDSVTIFERLLPLVKDQLENSRRYGRDYYASKWLPKQLLRTAKAGNLDMVRYLIETLGTAPSVRWFDVAQHRDPVHAAALHGHEDVLFYLLTQGFGLRQQSLEAAVSYGQQGLVRLMVQMALMMKEQKFNFGETLQVAIQKENEAVVNVLLSMGSANISENDKAQALGVARHSGLESMEKLIESSA